MPVSLHRKFAFAWDRETDLKYCTYWTLFHWSSSNCLSLILSIYARKLSWVEPNKQLSTHPAVCSLHLWHQDREEKKRKIMSGCKNKLLSERKEEQVTSLSTSHKQADALPVSALWPPSQNNRSAPFSCWMDRLGKKRSWCCAYTAQQQSKHWCAINAVLVTNSKHSISQAAVKKINSISARPNIKINEQTHFLRLITKKIVLEGALNFLNIKSYSKKAALFIPDLFATWVCAKTCTQKYLYNLTFCEFNLAVSSWAKFS